MVSLFQLFSIYSARREGAISSALSQRPDGKAIIGKTQQKREDALEENALEGEMIQYNIYGPQVPSGLGRRLAMTANLLGRNIYVCTHRGENRAVIRCKKKPKKREENSSINFNKCWIHAHTERPICKMPFLSIDSHNSIFFWFSEARKCTAFSFFLLPPSRTTFRLCRSFFYSSYKCCVVYHHHRCRRRPKDEKKEKLREPYRKPN